MTSKIVVYDYTLVMWSICIRHLGKQITDPDHNNLIQTQLEHCEQKLSVPVVHLPTFSNCARRHH